MDEAAVRAALAAMAEPVEVAEVAVEDGRVAVLLAQELATSAELERVHSHLRAVFPDTSVEVRAGSRVYRGGRGFGADRHVIAVMGGKGGVGKSTVTVNLALTLAAMGLKVGVLDGDLNAPDIPHMLGVYLEDDPGPARRAGAPSGMSVVGRRIRMAGGLGWELFKPGLKQRGPHHRPTERYGVELMSVGFVVPERLPPVLTGRVYIAALLRFLTFEVDWRCDLLLIDAPPGTGEEVQLIVSELPLSGAIFVTTPQDLAQMDAERTLTLLQRHHVPVLGMVQNMAGLTCPHCNEPIDMFAGSQRLADAGVPVLGRIPFDVQLSVTADQGRPLVLGDPRGPVAYEFARVGAAVRRWIARGE